MKDFIQEVNKIEWLGPSILGQTKDGEMGFKEWEEQGSPCLWFLIDHHEDIELYEDRGYGHLALFDKKTAAVEVGENFVQLKKYIGVSAYFTGQAPKMYKELK